VSDLFDQLRDLDEVTLLEVLDISVEDLIFYLNDYIEDNYVEIEERLQ